MSVDHIRYDLLAQEALRGVVRRVFADAAKNGLPGEHHFYVTFDTRAPGLKISPRLAAQHPEEMTIILQHQFWDLTVTEEGFEVGLSFKGVPERLAVPFDAIKAFFDPSVQFGLQFTTDAADAEAKAGSTDAKDPTPAPLPIPSKAEKTVEDHVSAPADGNTASGSSDAPSSGGEVVRLDRFRKK